jgi:chromosomal replication initiation ATPase DnaA
MSRELLDHGAEPSHGKLRTIPAGARAAIIGLVSRASGVELGAIMSRDRHRRPSAARHVAAWALRQNDMSYPAIGLELGRDHKTAMASCHAVEAALAWDRDGEMGKLALAVWAELQRQGAA